jgi:hypothetical protein
MSTLTVQDLAMLSVPPGLTLEARQKLLGKLFEATSEQLVAATAAASLFQNGVVTQAFTITALYVVLSTAAAAGESMVIDVFKNAVSILTAPFTIDDTKAAGSQIALPVEPPLDLAHDGPAPHGEPHLRRRRRADDDGDDRRRRALPADLLNPSTNSEETVRAPLR